jgi:hypothetical protein
MAYWPREEGGYTWVVEAKTKKRVESHGRRPLPSRAIAWRRLNRRRLSYARDSDRLVDDAIPRSVIDPVAAMQHSHSPTFRLVLTFVEGHPLPPTMRPAPYPIRRMLTRA